MDDTSPIQRHRRRLVVVTHPEFAQPDTLARTPKIPRNGRELRLRIDGTDSGADEDGPITRLVNHF